MNTTREDRIAILNALAALQALAEMADQADVPVLRALAAMFETTWETAVRVFEITQEEYQDVIAQIERQIDSETAVS